MEIPRYWRMKTKLLRLEPDTKLEDGKTKISLTGSSWFEAPNGHHKDENPLDGKIIFQAPATNLEKARDVVEITASSD